MALVICPECGDKVSNMAQACPHCGYPILDIAKESSVECYDLMLNSISTNQELKLKTIKTIREIKGFGLSEALQFINSVPLAILSCVKKSDAQKVKREFEKMGCNVTLIKSNSETPSEQDAVNEYIENIGKLVCPRCKSTQITTGTKGYGLIRGFIGSNKTVNRCGSCGYSWEP